MRHRVKAKHLNRDTNSRKALFKSLVTALIQKGEIETTEPKAKAIKGLVDKLIHKAQDGGVHARRILARFFGRRDIVNQLVDGVAPAMQDRQSGYTRIVRIGKRRGDNTMMVKMELVAKPEQPKTEEKSIKAEAKKTVKSTKPKTKKESK